MLKQENQTQIKLDGDVNVKFSDENGGLNANFTKGALATNFQDTVGAIAEKGVGKVGSNQLNASFKALENVKPFKGFPSAGDFPKALGKEMFQSVKIGRS